MDIEPRFLRKPGLFVLVCVSQFVVFMIGIIVYIGFVV